MRFPWQGRDGRAEHTSRWLRRRITGALLLVSSLPFLLLGAGAWMVFRGLAIEQTLVLHRTMARAHATAIDLYLMEKLHTLELLARTSSVEELSDPGRLRQVFEAVEGVHEDSFVDLGVIDQSGRHLAYVGPYDLQDRNYAGTDWFRTVMAQGSIVSDVFMGYRQVPHSVIAVRQPSPRGWWVLRATLDNRSLYDLVGSLEVGSRGDVFIVNRQGQLQTPSRLGDVLSASDLGVPPLHADVRDRRLSTPDGIMRQSDTWLNHDNWLLVVRQPEKEILAPVYRAVAEGSIVAAAAVLLVFVVTIVITSRLIARIETADRQRDLMYGDLIRSAKLASLGEMATGLAHEINNPLAIISAEQTNLGDEVADLALPAASREVLEEGIARCKRQVERCGSITAKMLQFGRKTETALRATDLTPLLRETGLLMERRARASGAALRVDLEAGLPPAWLDGSELEQVVVNLVNNGLDAVGRGGVITISARRDGERILLEVADDGHGIPPEDLDRIFEPFFTTKPPGQGTGLGLAVVYGIVRGWGGTIEVESEAGKGTRFLIHVPQASEKQIADLSPVGAP